MFDEGLKIFNDIRVQRGRNIVAKDEFLGDAPQVLYYAEPLELWVNAVERDQSDNILRDYRFNVSLADLMNADVVGPRA